MPTLDVSEVLSSPEFQDSFTVTSASRVISVDGIAIDGTPVTRTAYGVVIPDPDSMIRQDDGTRLSAAIDIYTQEQLTDGYKVNDTTQQNADVILWNGGQYVVDARSDFTNYGDGFIHVNAVSIETGQQSDSQGGDE